MAEPVGVSSSPRALLHAKIQICHLAPGSTYYGAITTEYRTMYFSLRHGTCACSSGECTGETTRSATHD